MKKPPPCFDFLATLSSCLFWLTTFFILSPLPPAQAVEISWLGANGSWSSGTQGGFDAVFENGDSVTFGAISANNTVSLSGTVEPLNVSISNPANTYLLNGGEIGGAGDLTKSGNGTAQISETTTLSYSGDTILSGGTLQYRRNAAGAVNLGNGTVRLQGGTLALAGNLTGNLSISNPFSVTGSGATINYSRIGLNPVWTLTGTLSLGGNLSIFRASGGNDISNFFTSGISVDSNATITIDNSSNSNTGLGTLAGTADKTLTLAVINSKAVELATLNTFAGLVKITGPSVFASTLSGVAFATAPSGNGLSMSLSDNGFTSFTYAISGLSDVSNISYSRGGSSKATGAAGSFVNLGSDATQVMGPGGSLVLDNNNNLNNSRLADDATIALNNQRFVIIGRGANSSPVNETIGNLSISGGAILNLDESNTNNSSVDITTSALSISGNAGHSLLIQTDANDFGVGVANSTITVTGSGASKPPVTNGMATPRIQQYDSGNTTGHFVAFNGDDLVTAASSYTNFADNSWSSATSTQIVNVTAATTLTSGGNVSVYALRIQSGSQNLGGRTIQLGSGGLISTSVTLSNGTIDFGSTPGFYGAYNAGSQITVSAILTGSAGLTILGTSQSVDLNSANTFTGGLFINGGRVTLGNATAANANDVTVNAFGELNTDFGTASGAVIGGLSGAGLVAADFQSTGNRYLAISPSSGTHTFEGRLTNGVAGKVLNLLKNGSGTQVFSADSTASFTGTMSVNAGSLLIDGDFSAATGAISVASGATLGGSGRIGGATTLNSGAILAPGNSPGILTFGSSLALNAGSDIRMEINGSSRGATYDAIDVTGALTYGGNLQLTFGQTFGTGSHAFNLWSFGSQSGSFDSITLAGAYTGSLTNDNGTWTLSEGLDSFEFSQATGSLALTVAVPEPGAWALMGIAAGTLLLWRRRTS